MKSKYILIAIALLTASLWFAACSKTDSGKADNMKVYTSEKAKFRIKFPKEPETNTVNIEALIAQSFVCQDPADTAVTYLANCVTIPREQVEAPEAVSGYLFGLKSSAMREIEALTTKVDKEISEYGNQGIYFEAEGPLSALAYKAFFVENRMYTIGVVAPVGKMPDAAALKAYFDSFEALK